MTTHTIAKGSIAQALAPLKDDIKTKPVVQGTNYFDLREQLGELLSTEQLRARVLSSVAWRIDTQVISLARALFYKLYEDNADVGTIDAFNEFIRSVSMQKDAEENSFAVGFEQTGPFKTMVALLNTSHYWHDAATEASAAAGMRYTPKSITQLLAEEKPQAVTALSAQKLGMIAKAVSNGDAEREEITTKLLISKEAQRNEQSHAGRQKTLPAVMRIIEVAQGFSPTNDISDEPGFHTFPLELQKQLIEFSIKAIETSLTQLASYTSISTLEYSAIIAEALNAQRKLAEVLKSPKFCDGVDMRIPVSYDMLPGDQDEDLLAHDRAQRAPATSAPAEVS